MYRIIGADQKQYGPISADQLRQWISEGRLNRQTMVLLEGTNEWKPAGAYPEFTGPFHQQTQLPPSQAGPTVAPGLEPWKAQLLATQPSFDIFDCLRRGWKLVARDPVLILGATAIIWLIESIWARLPVVNLLYFVFHGVLYAGLYFVVLQRMRGQPASIGEVFAGFRIAFPQLLLVGVLTSVLSAIGFFFCLLPGIYLWVAWTFSLPLVIDKRLDFWPAMELSRRVSTRVWFELFGLLVLAFLPFLLVSCFFGVKMLTSIFSTVFAMVQSGRPDPMQINRVVARLMISSFPWWLLTRFVLLLNLPFAIAALMAAYEDLFGSRRAATA